MRDTHATNRPHYGGSSAIPAAKKTQPSAATQENILSSGNLSHFDDNSLNGIVVGRAALYRACNIVDRKCTMPSLKMKLGVLAAGLMLSGCMQATTFEATNTTNFKPRDKELLAKVSYVKTPVAEPFRRAIVDYHRRESP